MRIFGGSHSDLQLIKSLMQSGSQKTGIGSGSNQIPTVSSATAQPQRGALKQFGNSNR